MKTQFIPIIACDFIDTTGARETCFQLCRHEGGTLKAVAVVKFTGECTAATATIADLAKRTPAIVRLARLWKRRSIPLQFISHRMAHV